MLQAQPRVGEKKKLFGRNRIQLMGGELNRSQRSAKANKAALRILWLGEREPGLEPSMSLH